METLKEGKRLWTLGWAVHWLRPKSKAPIEKRWTSGRRKTWEELLQTRPRDANMGVRLGTASRLKSGLYLGVIDCDVKSSKAKDLAEMREKFSELWLPEDAPTVESGRGNGSCHVYVASKEPLKPRRVAQSSHKVKVKMPSTEPSPFELANLTKDEIENGFRFRPAWEISIMGEGQQVVVPPSIHPDTVKGYKWRNPCISAKQLPVFKDPWAGVDKSVETVDNSGGELEPFSFKSTRLPQDIVRLVVNGEGSSGNRSDDLFRAARVMRNCGLSDNQVLWALTEESHWISEAARDRRGPSLKAQVEWVRKYTLNKIKRESSPQSAFKDVVSDEFEWIHPEPEVNYYTEGKNNKLSPKYGLILQKFENENPFHTIADMKTVFVFNGTHYVPFTPIEIKGFTERLLKPKPTEKVRVEFMNKVLANNITKRDFFTDTVDGKINFKNGVLDLESGSDLMAHSADFGFRGVLPYNYDPDADCPRFKKWVNGIMLGDVDLVAILQEFMGYVIRGGEYKYHKALWLEGSGRNGKSTFLDVLKGLIGTGNFSTISIKAIIGDKFAGADMDGKIANFSEETSPQELADSGPFKNLTGDGDLFVQKKFGDPYSFRNRAKLIMSYNQIPDLKDLSKGMLSRPIVIPFRKTIEDHAQDKSIKQKLLKELPGIFNFALEGWRRLEAQNAFTSSDKSTRALERITKESCNVFQWVENYVEFTRNENQKISAIGLYEEYRGKERYPYRFPEFARRLKSHPKMKERWFRDKKHRGYRGVETR